MPQLENTVSLTIVRLGEAVPVVFFSSWFGMHERVGVCEHRGSFLRSRVLCLCVMLCGMWSSAVSIDMIGVDYRSSRSIDLA